MDGTAAINNNLGALKRILAGLVGMAGLGERQSACRLTLPRHLRLAILRLLRPAEAAARRLIIAAARSLTVTLPPPRIRKPKPATAEPFLRRFGIAVVVSAGAILPRSRGRGTTEGGGGGGPNTNSPHPEVLAAGSLRRTALPLFDPPRRIRLASRRTAHAAPRIQFPGVTAGSLPETRTQPRTADETAVRGRNDLIDSSRLAQRLATLAAALGDLPAQATRFARWQARQRARAESNAGTSRPRRISPLRPGRPPGGRLSRFDPGARRRSNVREVDEILAHAHALALYALHPDTS